MAAGMTPRRGTLEQENPPAQHQQGGGMRLVVFPDLGSWLHWEQTGIPRRHGRLLRALQKQVEVERILVVEPAYPVLKGLLDPHRYRLQSGHVVWKRLGACVRKVEDKILALEWPAIPPSRLRSTRSVSQRVGDWVLRGALSALRMRPFVLFFGVPHNHRLIGRFGEVLSVFDDSGENWLNFCAEADRPSVLAGYEAIRRKADVILCSSQANQRYFERPQGEVHRFANGVDCGPFQAPSLSTPEDLSSLPRPWLGYIGTLDRRIDIPVLEALAGAFPSSSIILVGPVHDWEVSFDALRQHRNIHFLGQRPHRDVPRYVSAFDVCLVPHKVNSSTQNEDSLKVYEYLAGGRPIVSTPVPPAPDFVDCLHLATTPEEFVISTQKAVHEDVPGMVRARRQRVAAESWDSRAQKFLRILRDHAIHPTR